MATTKKPPVAKVDKAVERARARAEFRKSIVNASSESQVKIARERGKQRRSVEKVKTNQRVIERQQSEAARVSAYQQRSEISLAQARANRADRSSQDRRETVIKTATHTSVWETLVLLAGLFFVMIFLYLIVHNGSAFGGLVGGLGSFIHGLSSTTPLFLKKAVDTNDDETPVNQTNPGSGTGVNT